MNVMILSSSREEIDDYYKSIARSVSHYLASYSFDLVFGGSSNSMMGICYDEFVKNGRNIYAFTIEKYMNHLTSIPRARPFIKDTTFDMKKAMFENSDIIVALPGGIGTLSEMLSFIEEKRSNDKDIPIIIYDEDGFYQKLFDLCKDMSVKEFIGGSLNEYIMLTHNYDEFNSTLEKCIVKGRKIK